MMPLGASSPVCLLHCDAQEAGQWPLMSLQPTFKTLAITHSATAPAHITPYLFKYLQILGISNTPRKLYCRKNLDAK